MFEAYIAIHVKKHDTKIVMTMKVLLTISLLFKVVIGFYRIHKSSLYHVLPRKIEGES